MALDRMGATQNRLDPGDQLARIERLGHVVVRAELESRKPIGFLDPGRQHDDGHVTLAAQCLRHLETIHARQAEVQHDQVGPLRAGEGKRVDTVGRGNHGEAAMAQVVPRDLRDRRLVIDDKDRFHDGVRPR